MLGKKGLALSLGFAVLGSAVGAFLGFPGPAAAAPDGGGRHPHFDGGGVLAWSTKLADARKAAKAAGKLIFVEYGREA